MMLWRRLPSRLGRRILILISSGFIFMIGTTRIYLDVHLSK